MFDLAKGFSVGINIDDSWKYAGARIPESIIIPHLFSIRLPTGAILDKIDEVKLARHGHCAPGQTACKICEQVIFGLAEELTDARIKFVRCWFPMRFFEPALPLVQNDIDEDLALNSAWPLDSFVDILTNHGIDIIPVVGCGYQRMLPDGLTVDSDRSEYVKRVSTHASKLVRRYKSKIRYWQIENEPNWWKLHVVGGWRKGFSWVDPHGFRFDLLRELNKAVHSEDPKSETIINLEADTKVHPNEFADYCDLIGLDFYPNYKSASPIDASIFRKAIEVAKESGKPVIISETGYPSGPSWLGYTASKQAQYVREALSAAHDIDRVNGIAIWRYNDTAWRSFPFQENYFGLIDIQGKPKPAWNTVTEFTEELAS